MTLNLGELTEEQAAAFKKAVKEDFAREPKHTKENMEVWPDDATAEEVEHIIKGNAND